MVKGWNDSDLLLIIGRICVDRYIAWIKIGPSSLESFNFGCLNVYIYIYALFDPLSSLSYIDCRGSANLEMKQVSWRLWFWFPGPCYIVGCSARDMMPFRARDWEDRVFRWAVRDRTWMRLSAQRMLCIYIYILTVCNHTHISVMINDFYMIDYDIGKSARQESIAACLRYGPKSIKHLYSIVILICFYETHTLSIYKWIDIKHNVYENMNK